MQTIHANYVDIPRQTCFEATLTISNKVIASIEQISHTPNADLPFITPGFIDAHVHIESSLLVPSEFARLAVVHGTVATVSDPHEIANVCGLEGVQFMMKNGSQVPFHFFFGAPSCVPATRFETAGASLPSQQVEALLQMPQVLYLSEMMNFPGVIHQDEEVMAKIAAAHRAGKPVDGHAPGLRGQPLRDYLAAGISTDHECFTYEEAKEKLELGMKIIIREGSAARNFDALIPLLPQYADCIMFCSDDKHPDSLLLGHINQLCARAVAKGYNVYQVLQAACLNPVYHYQLPVGTLQAGQAATFLLLRNLEQFEVLETWIEGRRVAAHGQTEIDRLAVPTPINQFALMPISPSHLEVPATTADYPALVIGALEGQLITEKRTEQPLLSQQRWVPHIAQDVLKIAVINRYQAAPAATAFIKGFGLKQGAIASSVAHDSHNIVVVGTSDEYMALVVNLLAEARGGLAATNGSDHQVLPLPVAGLMSVQDGYEVAAAYTHIDNFAKQVLGSTLQSPFMTLSFMALLVIPHLKLSDKGLFDGDTFSFINTQT